MGELIDRSASFWRAHLGPLFKLALGFQIAMYLVNKLYLFALQRWFPAFGDPARAQSLAEDPGEAVSQLAFALGSMGLAIPAYFFISWVMTVALTGYAGPRLLGEDAVIGAALRHTARRLGATLGACALSLVWCAVVCLALMVPGLAVAIGGIVWAGTLAPYLAFAGAALTVLGFLVGLLWYMLRFFLTGQVLAMEDVGALAALRRSGALVSGRIGPRWVDRVKVRATILLTAVMTIVTVVAALAGVPSLILQALYGSLGQAHPFGGAPPWVAIPAELLQVLVSAAMMPLYVVFSALFYVDLRVRREGLDLERALELRGEAA